MSKSLAELWQEGDQAKSDIEDKIMDLLPAVHHIDTDSYDNSLEVYMGQVPDDFQFKEEQAKEIGNLGFGQVWLNFPDGTEQHASLWKCTEIHPRKEVSHPRWTQQMLEKSTIPPLS